MFSLGFDELLSHTMSSQAYRELTFCIQLLKSGKTCFKQRTNSFLHEGKCNRFSISDWHSIDFHHFLILRLPPNPEMRASKRLMSAQNFRRLRIHLYMCLCGCRSCTPFTPLSTYPCYGFLRVQQGQLVPLQTFHMLHHETKVLTGG